MALLVLFGPTGSGKTELLERALAGQAAEVISADSMQVYKGLDIGTAKPPPASRQALPHHLLDILEPTEPFSAGDFARLADKAVADISRRGKTPVVSGGAGFYISAFLFGLPEAPPADAEVRAVLKAQLHTHGAASLMSELKACDPVSAARIHINDTYRLLRALEVFRLTGRALSTYAPAMQTTLRPDAVVVGLSRAREDLYRRIDARAAAMFNAGLPDEVHRLAERGLTPDNAPALRAIGYREFFSQDNTGAWRFAPTETFPAVQDEVAKNSRNYAKRQMTYFKKLPDVEWLDVNGDDGMKHAAEKLDRIIDTFVNAPRGV
jgi:tRNA dimethylallyltransferase